MKIGNIEIDLNEQEITLLKLVHPLFEGLSFRKASKFLGYTHPTAVRIWNDMVKKYPLLKKTKSKWDNPLKVNARSLHNARRLSEMDDISLEDDDGTIFGEKVTMRF